LDSQIKVLIVDDTVVYRKILKDVVSEIDSIEVVGTAPNGDLALKKIPMNYPDLVLLDVEMPVMDGLETLQKIKKDYPDIGVIMVSGVNERQAAITMQALSAGAIDFVAKPTGNNMIENTKLLKQSLAPIISLFAAKKGIKQTAPKTRDVKDIITPTFTFTQKESIPDAEFLKKISARFADKPKKFDILVIGVSTGGPNALAKFVPLLPPDLNIPILVVQHMPPMFTKSLADHLNSKSSVPVMEAYDKQIIEKNKVYIAPGGKHMVVEKDQNNHIIALEDSMPVNSCKPSVDKLFDSIPVCFRNNILSLIMTGMGADGANGVKTLKRVGCYSLTQSAESCVVYGMPRAVVEAGLSDEIVELDRLATRVSELVKKGL